MPRWPVRGWVERFWSHVDQSAGPDSCWRWDGAHNVAAGRRRVEWTGNTSRPVFRLSRKPDLVVYVARLMLSLIDGVPLDERTGLEACHKPICPNSWCVNPAHLYWGTHEENVRDRYPMRAVDESS